MSPHGGPSDDGAPGRTEAWLDAAFGLLADSRRRFVVAYLRDREWATVEELTDVVTGWEAAERGQEVALRTDRDRTRAWLHHVAIPKLVDLGLVTYDPRTGRVRLVDLPPPLGILLDVAAGRRWDEYTDRTPTGTRRERRG